MNLRVATLAVVCIGSASFAVAQQAPPSHDTSPPSATSPSAQTEAPTTTNTDPSAASSPHQRQAMAKDSKEKMINNCIAEQRSQNAGMSKSDAKKTCNERLKAATEPANR